MGVPNLSGVSVHELNYKVTEQTYNVKCPVTVLADKRSSLSQHDLKLAFGAQKFLLLLFIKPN